MNAFFYSYPDDNYGINDGSPTGEDGYGEWEVPPNTDPDEKDWYLDNDGDGYHSAHIRTVGLSSAYSGENWDRLTHGPDCDDGNPEITTECNDDDDNTSKDDLKKAFSNLSDSDSEKLANVLNDKAKDFGIDTKEKLRHFLGQASHETGGFNKLTSTESTYYSTPSRLEQVWPSRFSQTDSSKKDPDDYTKNSSKLANFVYANRMGNGNEASGDGYKYRGRGIFQLTGKDNYQSFTNAYNEIYDSDKNFVTNPELLSSDKEIAILSALWFYQKRVLNKIDIDSDTSVKSVTKKVNGGTTGLTDRKTQFNKAKNNVDYK
ncbi:glycoside hydrolase family 19 protein [Maribacter sp. 2304DJ31-5]|uniref:glycoside hydrolase family 19 protein n=1 Tax=Maribacter sp. 2304DJ31-5 TaxID=3386273 RepID=UPI0039BD2BA4